MVDKDVVIDNLASMLRRMIWIARKETGDTSMKVLAGKAERLLGMYALQGSPLRSDLTEFNDADV